MSPKDGMRNPSYRPDGGPNSCSLAEKNMKVLVESKLKGNHHCTLATQKANGILGCTMEKILPLCSALHPVLGSPVQHKQGYTAARLVLKHWDSARL